MTTTGRLRSVLPNRDRKGVAIGLWPTKGDEDAEKPKSPVAYARGSECGTQLEPNRDREGVGDAVVFNGALPRVS